jgi:glycosyltransferase AglD
MKKFVIVIPAHNEEEIIKNTVEKTIFYLKKQNLKVDWKVVVGENGSSDNTLKILNKIPKSKYFSFISLKARSRSQAIKESWSIEEADFYMFMDADLATDIKHIPELLYFLEKGYDIVLGSRRLPQSKAHRPLKRKFISFGFHLIMNIIFNLEVKDLQCGFKAINKKVRDNIIPQTKYADEGFLDTEMLAIAKKKNYKVKEIPVEWSDSRESKFKISRTIPTVLLNSIKIKRDLITGKYT